MEVRRVDRARGAGQAEQESVKTLIHDVITHIMKGMLPLPLLCGSCYLAKLVPIRASHSHSLEMFYTAHEVAYIAGTFCAAIYFLAKKANSMPKKLIFNILLVANGVGLMACFPQTDRLLRPFPFVVYNYLIAASGIGCAYAISRGVKQFRAALHQPTEGGKIGRTFSSVLMIGFALLGLVETHISASWYNSQASPSSTFVGK